MTVAGVILAGGLARRMGGGDKPLLDLAGRPLLARVIERFAPQVDALALNANGDPDRFARFGLPVVPDTEPGNPGPLAGVLAGLRWAMAHHPQATHLATAAGDTPFLPRDLVARLATALEGADPSAIALPASDGGTHQVFALYPIGIADALEAGLRSGAARRVMAFIGGYPNVVVDFAAEEGIDPFFNANTPEELAEADAYLRQFGRLRSDDNA